MGTEGGRRERKRERERERNRERKREREKVQGGRRQRGTNSEFTYLYRSPMPLVLPSLCLSTLTRMALGRSLPRNC